MPAPKRPQKLVLIGLDAPIVETVERYAAEGLIPNIRGLIDGGTLCVNALAPLPTITPPNWTTIVTGAWDGTHGITCFHVHNPGDPLDQLHQAFTTEDCRAEYLWNAAERADKRSIIVNYPTTHPSTLEHGLQVAGHGLSVNEWRFGPTHADPASVASDFIVATEELPGAAIQIALSEAQGWANLPAHKRALEAELVMSKYRKPLHPVEPKTWHLCVLDHGNGFERLIVAPAQDASAALCSLSVGEWSDTLADTFHTEAGPKEAVFRAKLLRLASDGSDLRLYFTPLCDRRFYTHPEDLSGRLRDLDGLPLPGGGFEAYNLGWIDAATYVEVTELQVNWYAACAEKLMRDEPWDLYFMHAHAPDWMYHAIATKADPATNPNPDQRAECEQIIRGTYSALDRMIGRILAAAGDDVLTVIVSDHGAKATGRPLPVAKILQDAGLMVMKDSEGAKIVDWSKTRAVAQRSCYVYVNLKGRDPQGIVEPGEEYEQVREAIIQALLAYRDPESGQRGVTLALRREDARTMGLYGDVVGDVVYAVEPGFGGQHGQQLTTVRFSQGSIQPLLIFHGPGIKRGCRLERNAWLTDVVPTVCHLMQLPMPRDAEGAVLYQALESPDANAEELAAVRRNYEKLQEAYEKGQALTHTYNQ
ncbi:MAG: alkaline phosphatase family protein [Armatimonadota bacterium]|nr:MAG: alkaline phosphatase family protein [Armatimonadota bacterium]